MFPTIYGVALHGLGVDTKFAAAGLVMAIVGGAIMPPIQGLLSDQFGTAPAVRIDPPLGRLRLAEIGGQVIQPHAAVRTVYLPGKDPWYDFRTGERFDGGQVVAAQQEMSSATQDATSTSSVLTLSEITSWGVNRQADWMREHPEEWEALKRSDGGMTYKARAVSSTN
jgi:hypothetical protein